MKNLKNKTNNTKKMKLLKLPGPNTPAYPKPLFWVENDYQHASGVPLPTPQIQEILAQEQPKEVRFKCVE